MLDKNLPLYAIAFLSKERSRQFYLESPLLTSGNHESESAFNDCRKEGGSRGNGVETGDSWRTHIINETSPNKGQNGSRISDESLNVLRCWLSLTDPFLCQGEIFDKAGIRSGSKQARIKKELLGFGAFIEHRMPIGQTNMSIWDPTDKGYSILGIKKPIYHSKGGWLHQFAAHVIGKRATEASYIVDFEFMLPNGKAIDLVSRKGKQTIFIEIAITPPAAKELKNIHQDFGSNLIPDMLIVAAKDGKMKREIEEEIAAAGEQKAYMEKVRVVLAGDLIKNGFPGAGISSNGSAENQKLEGR